MLVIVTRRAGPSGTQFLTLRSVGGPLAHTAYPTHYAGPPLDPGPGDSVGCREPGAAYDRRVTLHEYPVDAEDQQAMLAWLDGTRPPPATARPACDGAAAARRRPAVEVFVLRRRAEHGLRRADARLSRWGRRPARHRPAGAVGRSDARRSGAACSAARPSWPRRWSAPRSASCSRSAACCCRLRRRGRRGRCQRSGLGAGPAGAARPQPGHVAAADPPGAAVALGPAAGRGRTGRRRSSSRGATTPGSSWPRCRSGQLARDVGGEADLHPLDRPGGRCWSASVRVATRCIRRPKPPWPMSLCSARFAYGG